MGAKMENIADITRWGPHQFRTNKKRSQVESVARTGTTTASGNFGQR